MIRALTMVAAAIAVVSGCTLINGSFSECEQDADCSSDRVCARRPAGGGYCVKPGCNETYGSTKDNAITLAAALPITIPTPTADGGIAYVPDESEIAGLNAIKLAVDEINENGGVGRREFSLIICDTTGEGTVLAEQVNYLSTQGVPAVITSGSSQTIAAANAAASATPKMLVMTATATSPALTPLIRGADGKDLLWRTAPSDELQAAVMARLLKTDTARFGTISKVAIVYVDDAYGQGLAEQLQTKLAVAPAIATAPFQLERSASPSQIANVATQVDAANPDLTILVLFASDATRFIAEASSKPNLKRSAPHQWFFADAAKDPALVSDTTVAAAVDGSYGTAPAQGAGPAFNSFATRYQTRHGVGSATSFSFTAHNYDAFYVLALATASAVGQNGAGELTGATISTGLSKLTEGTTVQLSPTNFTAAKTALEGGASVDVEGASGALEFDANGEAPSLIELWKVDASATPPIVKVEDLDPSL